MADPITKRTREKNKLRYRERQIRVLKAERDALKEKIKEALTVIEVITGDEISDLIPARRENGYVHAWLDRVRCELEPDKANG